MKRIRLRQDALNQGAFSVFQQRRRDDGRSALRLAIGLNETLELVSDRREIITGPVGAPRWLFKKKPQG
jgi:hypothetical protein